jgi:2,3-bisphosphoglycerate-dependent phosphoglycerate mutase
MKTGTLILARHHESEWNKMGKWTGKENPSLTEYGKEKSSDMGYIIADIPVDFAFTSVQIRSIETLSCILGVCKKKEVPTTHAKELNERDYGDYTGKNKWEIKDLVGEDEWNAIRRGWNHPVPGGETLKMVYERAVPFYQKEIAPKVIAGETVLVVAHGNSLRALTKYIESLSDQEVEETEFPFGVIVFYTLDESGKMITKETKQIESNVNA